MLRIYSILEQIPPGNYTIQVYLMNKGFMAQKFEINIIALPLKTVQNTNPTLLNLETNGLVKVKSASINAHGLITIVYDLGSYRFASRSLAELSNQI